LVGTVNYIGKANPFVKTKEGHVVHSLTGSIKGVTLDEIRMRDYYNLKNNTLHDNEKNKVQLVIDRNLRAEDTPGKLLLSVDFSLISFYSNSRNKSTF